jgi:aminoglycoside phosphotransferase (APT) family kinase protein
LLPPTFTTESEYGARLEDLGFWAPYAVEALTRHGLPVGRPEAGAGGTFPTVLVGRYVVKLFGEMFFGPECHAIELSLHRLLLEHPEIPAPTLVTHGNLFDRGWPWPYLITTRLDGTAWGHTTLRPSERGAVAYQVGTVIRRVHELPLPGDSAWERDWLAELRADCAARHRRWGTLPAQLIDQIDRFLVEPSPVRRVVHADLHGDHLFVDGARLVGIIDWGDAMATDPYYELPALHLMTFRGSKALLRAFLEGYGWEIGSDFARRAMTTALLHEFNPLGGIGGSVDLNAIGSLEELAELLWELPYVRRTYRPSYT